jgi:hypothetical protein
MGRHSLFCVAHLRLGRVPKISYRAIRICALPVGLINRTLGTDLEVGDAWLSKVAHQHFAEDHPDDYAACFPLPADVIESPTWLGQAAHHAENFELVTRLRSGSRIVLAAIKLERNRLGNYNVASVYCIEQKDVDSRRATRRLIPVIKSPR